MEKYRPIIRAEEERFTPVFEEVICPIKIREGDKLHDLKVSVWYHPDLLTDNDILICSGGYGEEKLAAIEGVKKMSALGLNSAWMVYPFDKKKLPYSDKKEFQLLIETVITEVPIRIAEHFNMLAGRKKETPVDLMGISMGGGAFIMSSSKAPERYRIIEAKAPAGINDNSNNLNKHQKILEFISEMLSNAMHHDQSIFTDQRNFKGSSEIIRRIIIDIAQGRFPTKIEYAMTKDLTASILKLYLIKGSRFALWNGDDDSIVPLEKSKIILNNTFPELGNIIKVYLGSHTGVYADLSYPQLAKIAEHLLLERTKPDKSI
jgi:hypothetical protein